MEIISSRYQFIPQLIANNRPTNQPTGSLQTQTKKQQIHRMSEFMDSLHTLQVIFNRLEVNLFRWRRHSSDAGQHSFTWAGTLPGLPDTIRDEVRNLHVLWRIGRAYKQYHNDLAEGTSRSHENLRISEAFCRNAIEDLPDMSFTAMAAWYNHVLYTLEGQVIAYASNLDTSRRRR